ncbi:MAG TPA: TonB-dependent receptor [Gemmatimonadaceae bacterium]|nr:TonB-dependent receptor [Gemmatimonadaceae bacterium]
MKFLSRLALGLALPLTLHAQIVVRGTVIDSHSGAPVAGALVRVPATAIATTTSDSGTFTLASAREVTALTVSRLGYATQDVTVSGTEPLRIALVPTSVELPGVQVLAHNPAPSTAEVTRGDIERFNGVDLPSVVNTIPGVFMQSRTPFGGARITIRGYYPSTSGNSPNSNGLGYQVFLNQIPVTDATGSTVLDDIDYSSMGRVEIIKGPASSLYGSPIGGTVNFTLARPTPNQTSVHQLVLGGGDGLLRTNTSVERASGTSDFVVNYGHQQDNSFRPHSRSRKSFVRANGDVAVGSDQNVSAFFTYNRSYEELAGEIDSGAFYARQPQANAAYLANDSHIQLTSFFTGVTDNYHISDKLSNQTSVFGNGRFSNQPFAHGYTDATLFNWGARSAFSYTGQAGTVDIAGRLGAQAQRSQVTSNGVFIVPAPPYPERPSATENYAVNAYAFTEWDFSLPGAVTITAGADLIHNTFAVHNLLRNGQLFDTTKTLTRTFPTVLAPRVQIQKGIAPHASLYASVSTGYTPPLLTNVVASDNTVNLALKPERAIQYEVGAQGSAFDQRLTGQIALFDLDNTNKLVNQTVNSVTSTVNIGEQRNTGAELSASYQLLASATDAISLLRPWLSYTYMNAKYVDFKSDANNNAGTVDFSNNVVARVPKHQVSAGLDASTRVGAYFNSTYQYVSRVPVTFDNSTWVRSYSLLSAKLGYKTMLQKRYQLDVAVGGDNLTNATYYTFLFVGPNYKGLAQAPDGGNGDGYIIPGVYQARYYLSANVSVPIM